MVQTKVLDQPVLLEEMDSKVEECSTVGQMVQREGVEVPAGYML